MQGRKKETQACKENRNTTNSSFPVHEEGNISVVQGLHMDTGVAKHQLFKCAEYDYAVSQSCNLKSRTNIFHRGLHPVKYPQCNYAASKSSDLKIHIIIKVCIHSNVHSEIIRPLNLVI